jgi:hypothetical protein
MFVHIENLLTEKDNVEIKTRQTLTDANIKSAKFIVFCGFDCQLLSEFFKVLSYIESTTKESAPIVFLYEEPGKSIYEHLDRILMSGIDSRRVYPKIHDNIIDCWSYRDIIGMIDIEIRRLGSLSTSADVPIPA